MIKTLRVTLTVLFVIGFSGSCYGLADNYKRSFRDNLRLIIDRRPAYVWGGAESEAKGLDCSGYIYLAARRSGMPVKRTTAMFMERGLAGWLSDKSTLDNTDELDLIWWTWKTNPSRVHGHVGVFLVNRDSGLLEVTHSSSRRGVIIQPLTGSLLRDMSSVRRLRLGGAEAAGR